MRRVKVVKKEKRRRRLGMTDKSRKWKRKITKRYEDDEDDHDAVEKQGGPEEIERSGEEGTGWWMRW
eukprot:137364-Hanusia_phi.AAC.1